MIDINNLPFTSKAVLFIGFALGIASFVLFLRYPIILILMKYRPDYREFIKRTIERKNQKKHSYYEKNYLRNRKSP
ncbi:Uncharacterised protein [uncultured archaeon]|nr:Uncharacterised protein [uncultured archaeon]